MFVDVPASTGRSETRHSRQFSLRALFSALHLATLVSAVPHLILVALWVAIVPLSGALILCVLVLLQVPIYVVMKRVLGPLIVVDRESSS